MPGTLRWSDRLIRAAAVLAAAAQLVIGAIAPALEARAAQNLSEHVEPAGTRLHLSHDEASCPSCSLRHLFAAEQGNRPPLARSPGAGPSTPWTSALIPAVRLEPSSPRPPPLLV